MDKKLLTAALASVFALGLVGGCTPDSKEKYDQAGENIGQAAEQTGEAMSNDAAAATDKAREGMGEAENVGQNALVTGKVKSALMAASDVDAEGINVDTVGQTVTLKGTVATEQQKTRAEEIAKDQAGEGFTIENQLTVGGGERNAAGGQ